MKALNWLEENNVVFEERPIKEQNPTYEELNAWYQMSGMPLKKFFNTSGLLYKDMGLKDKLPQMTEEEQLQLLATIGMLVKRPLVVGEDYVLTGFREKEWAEKILKNRHLRKMPFWVSLTLKRALTTVNLMLAETLFFLFAVHRLLKITSWFCIFHQM